MQACEEALRRLDISNAERNAVLETLRYCEQARLAQEIEPKVAQELPNGLLAETPATTSNLPLTQ